MRQKLEWNKYSMILKMALALINASVLNGSKRSALVVGKCNFLMAPINYFLCIATTKFISFFGSF